ncbi:MAG: Rieske 2Fe-2S domain-containing protein, partial [Chloroflexi bacterium]
MDEQLPPRTRRPAESPHAPSHQSPPSGAGAGPVPPANASPFARSRRPAVARRGHSRLGRLSKVKIGTYNDIKLANTNLPINEGFPAYFPEARAFVVLIDPSRQEFIPGTDTTGDGHPLNVRGLYQRCPHLGCRPNPCLKNFWFECPCHGSRYDRLGIKADGARFGPAPRSMDRFSATVDGGGVLTLDTG